MKCVKNTIFEFCLNLQPFGFARKPSFDGYHPITPRCVPTFPQKNSEIANSSFKAMKSRAARGFLILATIHLDGVNRHLPLGHSQFSSSQSISADDASLRWRNRPVLARRQETSRRTSVRTG